MELKEIIKKRRSVRNFTNRTINRKQVEEIITMGTWAPTACDNQGWKFIIIDDMKIKEKIVAEGGAKLIKKAPIGILVLYNNQTDNLEYQDYIQSAAAAIQNILLAATAMEISSCWICHLPSKATLRKIFKIPNNYDPIAYVVLGYREIEPKPKLIKYSNNQIISWNQFEFEPIADSYKSYTGLKVKRILRRIYFGLPTFLKRAIRPIAERFVKRFD